MKELTRWLVRRAAEERRRASLDSALLTGEAWRYAVYRVRFLFLRTILRAGLNLAEVLLFSALFSMDFLGPIIVLRGATAIAGGLWWGFLESLRVKVRRQAALKQWSSVRATIDGWLLFALALAGALLAGGTFWILATPSRELGFSIFDTYALGCFLRLACDIVSRTYHSGLFALRRIARPLWSLFVIDLADVFGVLVLWPFLGPWSFGIVMAAVGILRAVLTIVFVRHSMRRSKIPPFRLGPFLRRYKRLPFDELPAGVVHALANGAGQLDAILMMALVASSARNEQYLELAILLHLVRPFLAAGFGWARVFYFDFKKLEQRYSHFFLKRFQVFVQRAGVAFSLLLACVSIAWAGLFWPAAFKGAWFLLIPFFLGRSLFGIHQVQAFSYGRYHYLAVQAAAMGAVIAAVLWLPLEAVEVLALSSVMLLLTVLFLGPPLPEPSQRAGMPHASLLSLPRWLFALFSLRQPVRVGALLVHPNLETGMRAARGLADGLPPHAAVTRFGRAQLLWFEPAAGSVLTLADLVLSIASSARRLAVTETRPDGPSAWQEVVAGRLVEPALLDLLSPAMPVPGTKEELSKEFSRRFPHGVVLDDARGSLPRREYPMSSYQLRRLLDDVFRKSTGLSPRRCAIFGIDLSVYCPQGEPTRLFIVKTTESAIERASWRRLVDSATLLHSLSGKTP